MLSRVDDLPSSEDAAVFHGHEHGAGVSFFLSHNRRGTGPKLHRHPYEETFVVEVGDVLFTVGEETIEAGPGDVVVVPADVPHKPSGSSSAGREAPTGASGAASGAGPLRTWPCR